MIEIYLSSDGKNTLHLQSESTKELAKDLPFAKKLFQKILEEYGTKVQMWSPVMNGNGKAKQVKEEIYPGPLCEVHNEKMILRDGPYGRFIACPQKVDGEWCRGKPSRASQKLQEAIRKVI